MEDEIIVSGPTNLADSFLLLFGYVYALDLKYPKNLELTFSFIQKVVMCLEDNKPLKGRLTLLVFSPLYKCNHLPFLPQISTQYKA